MSTLHFKFNRWDIIVAIIVAIVIVIIINLNL